MRRTYRDFAVAVILFALLAVLATLQYRWLGQVSDAERERLRTTLRAKAADFAEEFDRELTRTYLSFHIAPDVLDRNPAAALADAYERAEAGSPAGGLVKTVLLVDAHGSRADLPQRLDPATRTLAPAEWPPAMGTWRDRARHLAPFAPDGLASLLMADIVDSHVPALVVPILEIRRFERDGHVGVVPDAGSPSRAVILLLDPDRLTRQFPSALARKHFGPPETSDYRVAIVRRDDPSQVVFTTGAATVTVGNADTSTGLFDLRLDDIGRFTASAPPAPGSDRVAITIVRRATHAAAAHVLMTGGADQGAWQLLVGLKNGSLDALVADSRRRNLAISGAILGLLAISFGFVIASAHRQQRLARQQIEFVAAVSHELRTPLAVIRSAAENLADGVVSEAHQVRAYGALVEAEGRRLTDMVERVMTFAGLTSGGTHRADGDVDIVRVIRDAVARVAKDGRDRGIEIVLHEDAHPGVVSGDADAIRSAVENVLANAIKYSARGERVDVTVAGDSKQVQIVVSDRGIGIDADELSQVFQPFFRGRRAIEAQIRGSGIGLSVVREVVSAHRGAVRLQSEPGRGTTVTIDLPLAAAA